MRKVSYTPQFASNLRAKQGDQNSQTCCVYYAIQHVLIWGDFGMNKPARKGAGSRCGDNRRATQDS